MKVVNGSPTLTEAQAYQMGFLRILAEETVIILQRLTGVKYLHGISHVDGNEYKCGLGPAFQWVMLGCKHPDISIERVLDSWKIVMKKYEGRIDV